ncbi:MAG: dTDP-4-dehydrorhamnose reductase [Deltaproteobacteria bacterium]|nr:dTDP-4-dehydrorhamnose reductase [Deltaproteobacteria bacterium]MBW1924578.1 dTDP-4-dehydrorhamnose reductase [Deltaproteobacteria bacterium]MBW1950471.1 dTDP-4-dehydrorhamnose reductase [Deltaproteobacteria bacterium]MBW2009173.1 dTDP-4-dehydrorhamnose reductase [Deltaproteobacteria bacterium]MBW2103240.1 dTDP-4-dehydrorhamnose reductase [Deltaproteobacteria bacterium]
MKVMILGSTGMLGSDCKKVLSAGHEVVAPGRKELDIVSWDQVIENLQKAAPDAVINCAAFTDVDACETQAFAVRKINVEGPRNLAQGSARFGFKFLHISSDYVFDGNKMLPQPYFEDDPMRPLSAYGVSKMESEKAVRENSPNYVILRTGWLYGASKPNFVDAIVRQARKKKTIKVADNQYGSPTWTYRVALQIKRLLEEDGRGTYHCTSEGFCSRFEYAQFIIDKLNLKGKLEPCKMADFPERAKRPANSILENRLLKKQRISIMRDWKEDLSLFLEQHRAQILKRAK